MMCCWIEKEMLKDKINVFLYYIMETYMYFLGNFDKNILYNCFKNLFLFVEKINIKIS